jgi:thiol:disulfide interchange protein
MKKVIALLVVGVITMAFVTSRDKGSKQEEQGIKFKHISLEEAKKKAAEDDQLIFIDAYTSWCGPCKKMAATSFQEEKVGELFNESFVNLKIDVEKDADGAEIARLYKIKAYPTLLFIDSNGKLVKQVIGYQTGDQLINIAKSVN